MIIENSTGALAGLVLDRFACRPSEGRRKVRPGTVKREELRDADESTKLGLHY